MGTPNLSCQTTTYHFDDPIRDNSLTLPTLLEYTDEKTRDVSKAQLSLFNTSFRSPTLLSSDKLKLDRPLTQSILTREPPQALTGITQNLFAFGEFSDGTKFTTLTFPFFSTPHTRERVQKVAQFLRQTKPGFAFLQEVWDAQTSGKTIAQEAGFPYSTHFTDYASRGHIADIQTLTRVKPSQVMYHELIWQGLHKAECGKDLGPRHRFGVGIVEIPSQKSGQDNRHILLVNIHLINHRPDEQDFGQYESEMTPHLIAQLIELRALLEPYIGKKNIVIGGDFNFHPGSLEYDVFKKLFPSFIMTDELLDHKYGEDSCTFCADNPLVSEKGEPGQDKIDRFAISGDLDFLDASIVKEMQPAPSDHWGLQVSLAENPRPNMPGNTTFASLVSTGQSSLPNIFGDHFYDDLIRKIKKASPSWTCAVASLDIDARKEKLDDFFQQIKARGFSDLSKEERSFKERDWNYNTRVGIYGSDTTKDLHSSHQSPAQVGLGISTQLNLLELGLQTSLAPWDPKQLYAAIWLRFQDNYGNEFVPKLGLGLYPLQVADKKEKALYLDGQLEWQFSRRMSFFSSIKFSPSQPDQVIIEGGAGLRF